MAGVASQRAALFFSLMKLCNEEVLAVVVEAGLSSPANSPRALFQGKKNPTTRQG